MHCVVPERCVVRLRCVRAIRREPTFGPVARRFVYAGAYALDPALLARLPEGFSDSMRDLFEPLLAAGKTPVIPSMPGRKNPRPYDKALYAARHLIENFFCQLKQFRAIATRYDKRAINFLGGIYAAAIVIWLN